MKSKISLIPSILLGLSLSTSAIYAEEKAERKKAVDQCLEIIQRQKKAANDSVLGGGANKPPAPVKPGP